MVVPTMPLPLSMAPLFTVVRLDDAIEPFTASVAGIDRRAAGVGIDARQRQGAGAHLHERSAIACDGSADLR